MDLLSGLSRGAPDSGGAAAKNEQPPAGQLNGRTVRVAHGQLDRALPAARQHGEAAVDAGGEPSPRITERTVKLPTPGWMQEWRDERETRRITRGMPEPLRREVVQVRQFTTELRQVAKQLTATPAVRNWGRGRPESSTARAARIDELAARHAMALQEKHGGAVDVPALRRLLCQAWRDPTVLAFLDDKPLALMQQQQWLPGVPLEQASHAQRLNAVVKASVQASSFADVAFAVQRTPGTRLEVDAEGRFVAMSPLVLDQGVREVGAREVDAIEANTARLESLYELSFTRSRMPVLALKKDWDQQVSAGEREANRAANRPVAQAFLRWAEESRWSPNLLAQCQFMLHEQYLHQPPEVFANILIRMDPRTDSSLPWHDAAAVMTKAFKRRAPAGADQGRTVDAAMKLWYRDQHGKAQARLQAVRAQVADDVHAASGGQDPQGSEATQSRHHVALAPALKQVITELDGEIPGLTGSSSADEVDAAVQRFTPYVEQALSLGAEKAAPVIEPFIPEQAQAQEEGLDATPGLLPVVEDAVDRTVGLQKSLHNLCGKDLRGEEAYLLQNEQGEGLKGLLAHPLKSAQDADEFIAKELAALTASMRFDGPTTRREGQARSMAIRRIRDGLDADRLKGAFSSGGFSGAQKTQIDGSLGKLRLALTRAERRAWVGQPAPAANAGLDPAQASQARPWLNGHIQSLRHAAQDIANAAQTAARLPADASIRRDAQLDTLAARKSAEIQSAYGLGDADAQQLSRALSKAARSPELFDQLGDEPLRAVLVHQEEQDRPIREVPAGVYLNAIVQDLLRKSLS
ncbi:hypothetical protein JI739_21570 [Ramlibacter sp. AW1]|uniref:Uncharacterized protein n=1 Tax=Ramlibacter aurantiacus TaxID=2801330 RepID=A0A936ZXK0_9BURK|nr:hypothetical protein [Ramlibacter aurantiacus]MBL0422940.1 hypothetical protein [Ramlibacter aurantiacus]